MMTDQCPLLNQFIICGGIIGSIIISLFSLSSGVGKAGFSSVVFFGCFFLVFDRLVLKGFICKMSIFSLITCWIALKISSSLHFSSNFALINFFTWPTTSSESKILATLAGSVASHLFHNNLK